MRRGGVWIAPETFVPPGRMVDPATASFWVSWQDDGVLGDEVITGAEAAIAWGRERASFVLIRLGHGAGSYFSAGDQHPPEADDPSPEPQWPPPSWPPSAEPPEGWWYPPPVPTRDEVREVAASLGRGDLSAADAEAWVDERLAFFPGEHDSSWDRETFRLLVQLLEESRR